MIDHAAARRLSATAIDFELELEERHDLDGHLRDCRDCRAATAGYGDDASAMRTLDYGQVPVAVRANVAIAAERRERGGGRGWVLLAAAAMLVVVVAGGLFSGVGSRGGGGGGDGGGLADTIGRPIGWQTPVVSLQAADFYLEAGGRTWVPPADAAVIVDSDPGDARYWTLEVTWREGEIEQRMNLYFASDGTTWRISEARIYDGRASGEWLFTTGPLVSELLGDAFVGDLVIDLADPQRPDAGPGRIVLRDARLAVSPQDGWAPFPGDPNQPVPVPVDPAVGATIDCGPADEATCSAIVARAMVDWANRPITLIRITSASGDHEIHFVDGDVVATIGN